MIETYADIIQVGSRNMQNIALLKELGKSKKTSTSETWHGGNHPGFPPRRGTYSLAGNPQVILCERGIRTFETDTRNTLTLATILLIKELSHLPIIVDPSHATGKRSLIASMTKAAVAAGADGVMIDVHSDPSAARCDGEQAILPEEFENLVHDMRRVAVAVDRT